MDIQTFISNYQEAFGMQAELPHSGTPTDWKLQQRK